MKSVDDKASAFDAILNHVREMKSRGDSHFNQWESLVGFWVVGFLSSELESENEESNNDE